MPYEMQKTKTTRRINSQRGRKCEAIGYSELRVLTSFRFFFLDTARTMHRLIHHRIALVDHLRWSRHSYVELLRGIDFNFGNAFCIDFHSRGMKFMGIDLPGAIGVNL